MAYCIEGEGGSVKGSRPKKVSASKLQLVSRSLLQGVSNPEHPCAEAPLLESTLTIPDPTQKLS